MMLTIGIIGTGVGIRTYVPAFLRLKDVVVKGVAGSSPQRAVTLARQAGVQVGYGSFQDLCDDPEIDLVCVASPNYLHLEHACYALRAQKNVLCEKPLAMTLGECDQLILIADQNSQKLAMVNHQLRFNPYIRAIRKLLQDGQIGRPYYCRIHQQGTGFSNRALNWSWSFESAKGGGVRLAMGAHLIDLTSYLFPTPFATVLCDMAAVIDDRQDSTGVMRRVTGSSFAAIRGSLSDGMTTDLVATAAAHGKTRFDISIYGDKGEIQFDLISKLRMSQQCSIGTEVTVNVDGVYDDEAANKVSIFSGSFRYFASAIREALLNNDPSFLADAADFRQARHVQVVLDACLASFTDRKVVRISGENENISFDIV